MSKFRLPIYAPACCNGLIATGDLNQDGKLDAAIGSATGTVIQLNTEN
jgi:hypothetical protein